MIGYDKVHDHSEYAKFTGLAGHDQRNLKMSGEEVNVRRGSKQFCVLSDHSEAREICLVVSIHPSGFTGPGTYIVHHYNGILVRPSIGVHCVYNQLMMTGCAFTVNLLLNFFQ